MVLEGVDGQSIYDCLRKPVLAMDNSLAEELLAHL